jgi:hypothetical protein
VELSLHHHHHLHGAKIYKATLMCVLSLAVGLLLLLVAPVLISIRPPMAIEKFRASYQNLFL